MRSSNFKNATCRIECGEESGSGFFVSGHLIMTSYHVIEQFPVEGATKTDINITTHTEKKLKAREIDFDADCDIALLEITGDYQSPFYLRLCSCEIIAGKKWEAFGYPDTFNGRSGGGEPLRGAIRHYIENSSHTIHDMTLELSGLNVGSDHFGGFSGSPVVDLRGQVFGILRHHSALSLDATSIKKGNTFLKKNHILTTCRRNNWYVLLLIPILLAVLLFIFKPKSPSPCGNQRVQLSGKLVNVNEKSVFASTRIVFSLNDRKHELADTADLDGKFEFAVGCTPAIQGVLICRIGDKCYQKPASLINSDKNYIEFKIDTSKRKPITVISSMDETINTAIAKKLNKLFPSPSFHQIHLIFSYPTTGYYIIDGNTAEYYERAQVIVSGGSFSFSITGDDIRGKGTTDKAAIDRHLQKEVERIVAENIDQICKKIKQKIK